MVVADDRGLRRFAVEGLRDPMAADPDTLLDQTKLVRARVSSRWQTYQAGAPAFVLRRARTLLQPPAAVQLQFENSVLKAEGHASHAWAATARPLATLLPGVLRYDDEALVDDDCERLARLAEDLKRRAIHFDLGSAGVPSSEARILSEVSELTRQILVEAGRVDGGATMNVIGHTDPPGDKASNEGLARRRAEAVFVRLRAVGTPDDGMVAVGASVPAGLPGAEDPTQRSVTFDVRLAPASTAKAAR